MIAKAKSKARTPLASAPYIPAQARRLRLEVRQRTRSLGRGFTAHLIKQLEASGVPPAQTEVMIDVFRAAQDSAELATKYDLKLAIADLRADLIKWMVGLALAQFGVLIGILLKLPH